MSKKKLDGQSVSNISISEECKDLIQQLKPPFESTDEYINRLMMIQQKFHQQKGQEFINMVFKEKFQMCTQDYFQQYQTKSKKVNPVDTNREKIKQTIQELFKDSNDPVLLLLLLIDEGVTLLFQTQFLQLLTDVQKMKLENDKQHDECVQIVK